MDGDEVITAGIIQIGAFSADDCTRRQKAITKRTQETNGQNVGGGQATLRDQYRPEECRTSPPRIPAPTEYHHRRHLPTYLTLTLTSLCSVSSTRLSTRHHLRLLLSAVLRPVTAGCARRPPLSIDICCQHGTKQQTHRTPLLWSNDGTDRRTPDRYTDPVPHMLAVPITV